MSVYEKMQPLEPALNNGAQQQSTPNYCTFDPLLPRGAHAVDVEACCPHCASYKARRAASRRRGWCTGCCGLLFKIAALCVLLVMMSKMFHFNKHWKFLDVDEDPSSFPFFRGEKVTKDTCTDDNVCSKTFNFARVDNFELRNLIQPIATCHHNYDSTKNFIQILEATGAQADDVVVDFSFNVSNPATQQLLEIEQSKSSLLMRFPTSDPRVEPSCNGDFSSWTKVYIRKGLHLKNLNLESSVFNVEIPEAIDAQVDNANVKLTTASLNANPFVDAKSGVVSTGAGSARGTFLLHDSLKISAEAGSISVDVVPQEAEGNNKVAVLDLSTQAGQINARFPPEDVPIPAREYHTTVTTVAGSVRGRYIHGKETTLRGSLGGVDAVLIPYISSSDEKSTLTTTTDAGMQRVRVLSPVAANGGVASLKQLDATHTSSKGGMSVEYPPEWEGSVEAETTAGTVNMEGPGLEVTKVPVPGFGLKMTGTKGSGDGFTRCSAEYGRVSFEIGSGKEL